MPPDPDAPEDEEGAWLWLLSKATQNAWASGGSHTVAVMCSIDRLLQLAGCTPLPAPLQAATVTTTLPPSLRRWRATGWLAATRWGHAGWDRLSFVTNWCQQQCRVACNEMGPAAEATSIRCRRPRSLLPHRACAAMPSIPSDALNPQILQAYRGAKARMLH